MVHSNHLLQLVHFANHDKKKCKGVTLVVEGMFLVADSEKLATKNLMLTMKVIHL